VLLDQCSYWTFPTTTTIIIIIIPWL
jgi:hypothetical protein